jgi:hypothetical protein
MQRLLEELIALGVLDPTSADWAMAHRAERGGSLASALLALDLVDEAGLLRGLELRFRVPCLNLSMLEGLDRSLSLRFPEGFSRSFSMCPLEQAEDELVVLVERPLPEDSKEELRHLFGLNVRQCIATAHHLELARAHLYGAPLSDDARMLEARLGKRRGSSVGAVAAKMSGSAAFADAASELLDFASRFLDLACFLIHRDSDLRVAAIRGGEAPRAAIPVPRGSTLGAALEHGAYGLGSIDPSLDGHFYRALRREPPRRIFVAPVSVKATTKVLFYGDNGPRGIAPRVVAELTILVARLAQPRASMKAKPNEEPQVRFDAQEPEAVAPPARADDPADLAAIERLRNAAARAGMSLGAFVDDLLNRSASTVPAPASPAPLATEVKELFDKLATDIPAQLARGMEAAFRNIVPRLSTTEPSTRPAAAPMIELVAAPATPKEVPSYESRRRKSARVKL